MAKATNLGIFMMLIVVAGMLASFAAFFIYLNRRARMIESLKGTEGIAQC
jgi:maltodextrin utilization protein YvdJ